MIDGPVATGKSHLTTTIINKKGRSVSVFVNNPIPRQEDYRLATFTAPTT